MASDVVTCEAILLARTVPEETRDGEVGVCSAWWQPSLGGLVRVYPLKLGGDLHAWDRYELQLVKSRKDSRWRSYKLADEAPRLVGHGRRDDLRDALTAASDGVTIRRLNERRDSMGVIAPRALAGILEHDDNPVSTHRFGRKTYGIRPRLHFVDTDGEHELGLNEWGCYEWLRKGGEATQLWANLRLDRDDREHLLLVGNLRDHPTAWVVIAVIGYSRMTLGLWLEVPSGVAARIFERDHHRCVHCGSGDTLTIDHVIPRSRGGTNEESNLRTLCQPCNSQKGDRLDSEWLGVAS
jgi:hypothetical protein